MAEISQPRLLIFIVAYQAEKTIRSVLTRIPLDRLPAGTEVLVIDDQSADRTFDAAEELRRVSPALPLRVLYNPRNRGYGGNQKLGYHYAIRHGFDAVALLHGDGQYAPECLPDLVQPVLAGEADACFGSRMLTRGGALKGGMPFYKFVGNHILSFVQNRILGRALSEFHSGYRVYSVKALQAVPFDANTDDFHFDTEIIVQFILAGRRIVERPIPTYYGDEICRVNGMRYAWDVMRVTLQSWFHQRGLLYKRKYDVTGGRGDYGLKLGYESTHTLALEAVGEGAAVLDLACGDGVFAAQLKTKSCRMVGLDQLPADADREHCSRPQPALLPLEPQPLVAPREHCSRLPDEEFEALQRVVADRGVRVSPFDRYIQHDLDAPSLPEGLGVFDYILCLDCIEHLKSPERFLMQLRQHCYAPRTRLILTTGNIGFIVTRLGLLLGQFNYGRQGILDLTHTRLFTFRSFVELLEQQGYDVKTVRGVAAPFPKALGNNAFSRVLVALNRLLIRLARGLFSYQIYVEAEFLPTLDALLAASEAEAERRRSG